MFKRFNNYLLTHHPLIWNTRVVWVLAANLLLHLFFYLMGMFSFAQSDISKFYSISSMGGGTLFTLSVLCSLLTLIFWLVFYLRNNAFKSNYVIGTWHLAKETLIILLIVFTSITYFESFFLWGSGQNKKHHQPRNAHSGSKYR